MEYNIILFDLSRSSPQACWSPNAWKTRLVLNYKTVPYTTCWLEYNDIQTVLEPLRKSTGDAVERRTTIPTIGLHDPNLNQTKYITDSKLIAEAIETKYPSPPLHLEADCVQQMEELFTQIVRAFGPIAVPKMLRTRLNKPSAEHERQKWEAWLGVSLEQWELDKGGEKAWQNLQPLFQKLADLLSKTQGPFFLGKEVSYADLLLMALLLCLESIDDADFARMISFDKMFKDLFDGMKPLSKRSSF